MSKKQNMKQTFNPGDPHNVKITGKIPSMVAAPQQRAGVTTRSVTAQAKTTEPWMYRYTVSTFDQLHALIYPILHELAMLEINVKSYFTKRWKQLTTCDQLTLCPKMTWKQAQDCLGIFDLAQYKDFVLQCPKIQDRIKIAYAKGIIALGVIEQETYSGVKTKYNSEDSILQLSSNTSSLTIINHTYICDETPEKFQTLLKLVIDSFFEYIENFPNDPYSRICQEWFDKGLTVMSNPYIVYEICNLSNLEDLYFLLRISPPTKNKLTVNWVNNTIEYEVIPQPEKVIIESPRTPSSSPAQTISDVPTWQTFNRTIYPIIEEWIATSPHHPKVT
jgi:hypothetical protein